MQRYTCKKCSANVDPSEIHNGICDDCLKELNAKSESEHQWQKTNIKSLVEGDRQYDTLRCACCGVTGRRFTGTKIILRDKIFAAGCYATCTAAKLQTEKNSRRKFNLYKNLGILPMLTR